jgi:hypothetical protein
VRQITLPAFDTPKEVGVGGKTLVLLNAPAIDYGFASTGYNPVPQAIIVGVSGAADSVAASALVVPPYHRAVLPVPDGASVWLAAPNNPGAQPYGPPSFPYVLYVDWSDLRLPADLQPLHLGPWSSAAATRTLYGQVWDAGLNVWLPQPPSFYYDEAMGGGGAGLRPQVGVSLPVSMHAALAANTLTPIPGWPAISASAFQTIPVVKRITISMTAAGLFVVGGYGLTVGSPGFREAGRATLQAGAPFTFEFGPEGIPAVYGGVGANTTWQVYSVPGGTVDLTAYLG